MQRRQQIIVKTLTNLCRLLSNYETLKPSVCVCVKRLSLFKNNGKTYFILSTVPGNIRKAVAERYVIYSNVALPAGSASSLNNDHKVLVCTNINRRLFPVVTLWRTRKTKFATTTARKLAESSYLSTFVHIYC